MSDRTPLSARQEELRTFLFLCIVTAPILAVLIVSGYGFGVWIFQILTGRLPTG
ncbi:MAG TPA: periplasmic nitrate reductase, NapE protein [Azoarcus sp.]|nr:periplasmic nitrate reductase, NapE protein [Azoarcus sp.]